MSLPDVVYVVKAEGDNDELRYSLRTLQNIPHGKVWLVGHRPRWAVNVEHLPTRNHLPTKYQNSTANLLTACTHDDVADEVIYMNDDFFILRPLDRIPHLHMGPVENRVRYYDTKYERRPGRYRAGAGRYRDGMVQTADLLRSWGVADVLSYEVHAPMLIDRRKMAEAINRAARETRIVALHKRTLYGNLYRVGGELVKDVKVLTSTHTWSERQRFVSTSNQSWKSGSVGKRIRRLFAEPSAYERS